MSFHYVQLSIRKVLSHRSDKKSLTTLSVDALAYKNLIFEMGNAIAKKFDSPKDYSATAGHCGLYKIWEGKKQETSEEISVWTFDKGDLAKRKSNPLDNKALQEQVLQLIRRDFTCLKECNCGGIIQILEVKSSCAHNAYVLYSSLPVVPC